jgi:hypothetical protein
VLFLAQIRKPCSRNKYLLSAVAVVTGRSLPAVAECRKRGTLQLVHMAVAGGRRRQNAAVFDDPVDVVHEVALAPWSGGPLQAMNWNPYTSVWPVARDWKGPLSQENVDKAREHQLMHTRFGSGHVNSLKKYFFEAEYNYEGETMWVYKHCKSVEMIIIRPIQESPEIHAYIRQIPGGIKITAVAEDQSTILEQLIYEDERAKFFKAAVHIRCVHLNLCSDNVVLKIYLNNILMNSNLMLHSDQARRVRQRAGPDMGLVGAHRVLVAHDAERAEPVDVIDLTQPEIDSPQPAVDAPQPGVDAPQPMVESPGPKVEPAVADDVEVKPAVADDVEQSRAAVAAAVEVAVAGSFHELKEELNRYRQLSRAGDVTVLTVEGAKCKVQSARAEEELKNLPWNGMCPHGCKMQHRLCRKCWQTCSWNGMYPQPAVDAPQPGVAVPQPGVDAPQPMVESLGPKVEPAVADDVEVEPAFADAPQSVIDATKQKQKGDDYNPWRQAVTITPGKDGTCPHGYLMQHGMCAHYTSPPIFVDLHRACDQAIAFCKTSNKRDLESPGPKVEPTVADDVEVGTAVADDVDGMCTHGLYVYCDCTQDGICPHLLCPHCTVHMYKHSMSPALAKDSIAFCKSYKRDHGTAIAEGATTA